MDNIEKVELEWQKIWLQILTGLFLPQGVNETVHDFAESMKIFLRSMNCAWYDECESPSEGEELIWAREAESLITWRSWKSLIQEYRAMLPKVEPDSFEEAIFMAKAVEYQLNYVNSRAAINPQRYPIISREELTFEISKKRNEMTENGRERNYKIRIKKLSIYRIHEYVRPEFSKIERKRSIKGAKFIVELAQLQKQLKIGRLNISEGGGNFLHVEENQICDDETFKSSETHDQQSSVTDDTPNKKCTKLGVSEVNAGLAVEPCEEQSQQSRNVIDTTCNQLKNTKMNVEIESTEISRKLTQTRYNDFSRSKYIDRQLLNVSETLIFGDSIKNNEWTNLILKPGTGKGPKQTISSAINHSIGKSKHGEEVHEARNVIIAQDKILENRRLEKKLEYLQPVCMDFDDILKSSISETFLSEMHVHENYATQNCGPAAVKRRQVTEIRELRVLVPSVTSAVDISQHKSQASMRTKRAHSNNVTLSIFL
ncbi:hypothetical protein QAD02_002587 [Eretmocerus hayati]|uniref:Uncharacterized protein n=1 Tax=Eretmocerus hayati TaxID=131215 RepID=A0ACC2NKI3_9HYME|nr:hypothetical protein QAD02_002587 [Eretmocerus hayati]